MTIQHIDFFEKQAKAFVKPYSVDVQIRIFRKQIRAHKNGMKYMTNLYGKYNTNPFPLQSRANHARWLRETLAKLRKLLPEKTACLSGAAAYNTSI